MGTRLKVAVVACLMVATAVTMWFVAGHVTDSLRKQAIVENQEKARTLVRAALSYAQDHEETYPDATRWEEELKSYLPEGFSVALVGSPPHRFAMNSVFSKRKMTEMGDTSSAALFFESTATNPSANDELKSLPTAGDVVVIGYAPGHVYAHPIAWVEAIKDPTFHKQVLGK